MDKQLNVPQRLMYTLGAGEPDPDDLDIVEAMFDAEGLVPCPPHLIHRAQRLAQPAQQQQEVDGRGVGALFAGSIERAVSVFDSWIAPQPLGVRGGGMRHLLFRAESADISITLQPTQANTTTVIGQVLGTRATPGDAILFRAAEMADDAWRGGDGASVYGPAPLDDLGEFVLPGLPPGRYTFSLRLAERQIDSTALDVPAPLDAPVHGETGGDR